MPPTPAERTAAEHIRDAPDAVYGPGYWHYNLLGVPKRFDGNGDRIPSGIKPLPERPAVINVTAGWSIDGKKNRDARDRANMHAFCQTMQPYTPLYWGTDHDNYTAYVNLMQGGFRDKHTVNQFMDTRLTVRCVKKFLPFNDIYRNRYFAGYISTIRHLFYPIWTGSECTGSYKETTVEECVDTLRDLWDVWSNPATNPTGYKAYYTGCVLYEWEILH